MGIIPYKEGMFILGAGYDSLSGNLRLEAIENYEDLEKLSNAGIQYSRTDYKLVESHQELVKHLNISTSASINASLYGSVEGKMGFLSTQEINKYSVYILAKVVVKTREERIRQPRLTTEAKNVLKKKRGAEIFRQRFGDEFVLGTVYGGEFIGLLEIKTENEQQKKEISTSIKGSHLTTLTNAKANAECSSVLSEIEKSYQVNAYNLQSGGDPGGAITPEQMIEKVINFPHQVQNGAEAIYRLLLFDYTAILGECNVDLIDINDKQAKIEELWEYRQKYLDLLSNIKYILRHNEEFKPFDRNTLKSQEYKFTEEIESLEKMLRDCTDNKLEAFKSAENYQFLEAEELPQRKSKPVEDPYIYYGKKVRIQNCREAKWLTGARGNEHTEVFTRSRPIYKDDVYQWMICPGMHGQTENDPVKYGDTVFLKVHRGDEQKWLTGARNSGWNFEQVLTKHQPTDKIHEYEWIICPGVDGELSREPLKYGDTFYLKNNRKNNKKGKGFQREGKRWLTGSRGNEHEQVFTRDPKKDGDRNTYQWKVFAEF